MPTWGQILKEIQELLHNKEPNPFDFVRNKYLKALSLHTGRDVIVYATRWASGGMDPNLVSINEEDIHAFMEAVAGLKGKRLDLILHTGGGSAEATDSIVSYLRKKFEHIRIIIPQAAMSAGTMLACSADIIFMGKQSSIGPIDPQFILSTSVGVQAIPAQAILKQFKKAQEDCAKNPKNLNSWMPMLGQYGPALLVRCQDQIDFGKELVEGWLSKYMFKNIETDKPKEIAEYLSNHDNFKTHGKHLNVDDAKALGLKINDIESTQELQDAILSAFHATMHAFGATTSAKIIANHNGNCFVKHVQPVRIPGPPPKKK